MNTPCDLDAKISMEEGRGKPLVFAPGPALSVLRGNEDYNMKQSKIWYVSSSRKTLHTPETLSRCPRPQGTGTQSTHRRRPPLEFMVQQMAAGRMSSFGQVGYGKGRLGLSAFYRLSSASNTSSMRWRGVDAPAVTPIRSYFFNGPRSRSCIVSMCCEGVPQSWAT